MALARRLALLKMTFIVVFLCVLTWNEVKGQYSEVQLHLPTRSTLAYYNYETNYNNVTFRWKRETELSEFEMMMESDSDGYVAVGFCNPVERTKSEGMEHCDIALGWVDVNGQPHLHDLFSRDNGIINEDEGDSDWMLNNNTDWAKLLPVSNSTFQNNSSSRTVIHFKRKAITGKDGDVDLKIPLIIIWAKYESDPKIDQDGTLVMSSVGQHLSNHRGFIKHSIVLNTPKLVHSGSATPSNHKSVVSHLLMWILLAISIRNKT